MWEDRYTRPGYLFGTDPADYLHSHATLFAPGQSALCVADGEGRNSVWLAAQGLTVTALEYAPSAVAKARALAAERGVAVTFRTQDVLTRDWGPGRYDHVLGIFVQFAAPPDRARLFARMAAALYPGGLLHLHGYTPDQIRHGTGGPSAVENLYTPDLLAGSFRDWDIIENRAFEAVIEEGTGHSGLSALVDFIARKPGVRG